MEIRTYLGIMRLIIIQKIMNKYIPLCVPSIGEKEKQYVNECIDTEWISSAGKFVDRFENKISEYVKSKYAVACVNGTSALQVSLRMLGVQNNHEVIVPTLTFIAPINAIAYNGAKPIFMDADNYFNIDQHKTISFIKTGTFFNNGYTYNKLTKRKITAIIPVHVWGNAVWMDDLVELCNKRNIAIIEDGSESLGTIYSKGNHKGQHTGTIGKIGCISFNGNKIITTGGGGMIITDSQEVAEKAKYLTTQAKDDPINYIHDNIGYNFRLTNIQAAIGVGQLEQLPDYIERKQKNFSNYVEITKSIDGLSIVKTPSYAKNNHWLTILKIDEKKYGENRKTLMYRLENSGIQSRPVWGLNHLQKPYRDYQSYSVEKATELINNSLCLPSSVNLDESQMNRISNVLSKK